MITEYVLGISCDASARRAVARRLVWLLQKRNYRTGEKTYPWLPAEDVCLRSPLCVDRSLAILNRSSAALAAFDDASNAHALSKQSHLPACVLLLKALAHNRPLGIKATTLSHHWNDCLTTGGVFGSVFELRDAEHAPVTNTMTPPTARTLAATFIATTGLLRMIDAIVTAKVETLTRSSTWSMSGRRVHALLAVPGVASLSFWTVSCAAL